MTKLNIQLPQRLKDFAEKQAAARGLPNVSAYLQSLLTLEQRRRFARKDIEAQLQAGLDSGEPIAMTGAYWAKKRAKLLGESKKRKSA